MADNPDDFAVLLHLVKVSLDAQLPSIILPTTRRLSKGLLLRTVPSQERGWEEEGKRERGRRRRRRRRKEGAASKL